MLSAQKIFKNNEYRSTWNISSFGYFTEKSYWCALGNVSQVGHEFHLKMTDPYINSTDENTLCTISEGRDEKEKVFWVCSSRSQNARSQSKPHSLHTKHDVYTLAYLLLHPLPFSSSSFFFKLLSHLVKRRFPCFYISRDPVYRIRIPDSM